ncbi:hypothetical protein HK100_009367, partial [Physocladia obscura]
AEFSEKQDAQEELIKSLNLQYTDKCNVIQQMATSHKLAIRQAFEEKEVALTDLETRISAALKGKDEHIHVLMGKLQDSTLQIEKLKKLIERECKQLL